MADEDQVASQRNAEPRIIQPQKLYLKDVSFEAPNSPESFTKEGQRKLSIEFDSQVSTLEDDLYDVVLVVTVTMFLEDAIYYLAEAHQGGIFLIRGYEPEELKRIQNVYCLRTLYPYVSALLTDLVARGGFQQLLLAPMNFDALYRQQVQADQEDPETPDAAEAQE